jgi:chemotaxis protein methyltransferase CheR
LIATMPISSEDFDYIRSLVEDHSAISLDSSKEYLVESRLYPLARQEGLASLGDLVSQLKSNSSADLHRKVVEAMTTNETSFFRDMRVFEMLRRTILPELLTARAQDRALRIWCAACSTGQEPYSLAMLIREYFPHLKDWNVQLIASDFSRDALERARSGRYNQLEVNRGLPASLLVKYFQKREQLWEIDPEIRRMVDLCEINLSRDWPFLPRMDLIFMRNVLIYMRLDAKRTILSRVRSVLSPDGYVVLGGAEMTSNIDDGFEPLPVGGPTCFRLRPRVQASPQAGR